MRFNQPLSPTAVRVYDVRPRKDRRGADFLMRCHSVGCGTASQTQSAMQSCIAAHMTVLLTGSKKCGVTKRATVQRRKCLAQRH